MLLLSLSTSWSHPGRRHVPALHHRGLVVGGYGAVSACLVALHKQSAWVVPSLSASASPGASASVVKAAIIVVIMTVIPGWTV